MASLADKKKALDWSNRNARVFQGILDVNQFLPVTGDIQSGIMAGQDLQKGNYGSAALNSLGLLPFIPALGGITAFHGSPLKELSELNPNKSFGRLGVSWVSPSEDFAKKYIGKEGKVYKVDLNEGKQFNFANKEDLNKLKEAAKNIEYYDPVRGFTTLDKRVPDSSSYYSAEDPMLFNLIKKMGYDTVSVTENGVKNIGVFNPKKNAKLIE